MLTTNAEVNFSKIFSLPHLGRCHTLADSFGRSKYETAERVTRLAGKF
jgi:hypothetical protein